MRSPRRDSALDASAEYETVGKGIVGCNEELAPSGDPRASFDLRHDCCVALPLELARDASGEACADDALDHEWLTRSQTPTRPLDRDTRRDAGPRRRPVDLALRKNADVARVGARSERGPGEDRAVQERQVRLAWMADLARGHDRALDRRAGCDQIAEAVRGHLEADARGVDERVEGAAESYVIAHLAHSRDLDAVVERDHIGRHVLERDAPDPSAVAARTCGHSAGGRVEPHLVTRAQEANLEGDGDQRDHAVAAHRAPALVVQEEHTGIP